MGVKGSDRTDATVSRARKALKLGGGPSEVFSSGRNATSRGRYPGKKGWLGQLDRI